MIAMRFLKRHLWKSVGSATTQMPLVESHKRAKCFAIDFVRLGLDKPDALPTTDCDLLKTRLCETGIPGDRFIHGHQGITRS
jgi:hypothetical protein